MIPAMADVRARHGVILTELNIGGGHGIPYLAGDPELSIDELAQVIDDALDDACAAEHFPRPTIVVEPGRAISARAGVTLYEVCGIKAQPGGRTFVAVDGGMSYNPRVSCTARNTLSRLPIDTLSHRGSGSRWRDGTAKPATRSPATLSCRSTCIPATCWRWRAPAPTTTAWRRTTTWSAGHRWWRSRMVAPVNWSAAKRPPTC